jgi:carbamoyl-phosphate synthase large subunit
MEGLTAKTKMRKTKPRSPTLRSRTRVLVTGVTGGGVGFGVLEALIKAGYQVYATDITPYSVGLLKARKGFVVPLASEASYLKTIRTICRKNKIRIIVPGSESELFHLSEKSAELEEEGLLLIANDRRLIATCRDKWKMFKMFRDNGIPCPDSGLPEMYDDFRARHGFPILLKQRTGSGSRNLLIAKNHEDYLFCSAKLNNEHLPFLLQEYIGKESEEYTVGVVCRKDGSVLGSITVHRILEGLSVLARTNIGDRTVKVSTGISQGTIEDNKLIQRQCESYAVKLGVTGPANFQGRLIDGLFTVFELNPRFSGTTPFRASVGFNDVDMVIRDRLNQSVMKPRFRSGIVALRILENVLVPLERIRKLSVVRESVENG